MARKLSLKDKHHLLVQSNNELKQEMFRLHEYLVGLSSTPHTAGDENIVNAAIDLIEMLRNKS